MEPFDYEKAKCGDEVRTRDGRCVRIVCWDVCNADFPLLALVKEKDGHEHPYSYTANGRVVKGGLKLDSDLVMKGSEKIIKMYEKILAIKFVFKDEVGVDFLEQLASKCDDTLNHVVSDGRNLLIVMPFIKGAKLYSYMNRIVAECKAATMRDFRCVYIDDQQTFGECGYYETCDGVLLGTRFVNKTRQDRSVREFFTKDELTRCRKC